MTIKIAKTIKYRIDEFYDEETRTDEYEYDGTITKETCTNFLENIGNLSEKQANWVYEKLFDSDEWNFDDALCCFDEKEWLDFLHEYFYDKARDEFTKENY